MRNAASVEIGELKQARNPEDRDRGSMARVPEVGEDEDLSGVPGDRPRPPQGGRKIRERERTAAPKIPVSAGPAHGGATAIVPHREAVTGRQWGDGLALPQEGKIAVAPQPRPGALRPAESGARRQGGPLG